MDPRTAQPSGQRPSHQNGSALPVPAPLLSGIPTPPPAADPHLAATQIAALQQIQQAQVVQQLNAAVASRFGVFPAPPQGTSVVLGGIDLGWLGPSAVAELVLRALQGISDAGLLGARAMLMARAAPALPVAPVAAPSARDPRRRDPRLASKKDREDTPEVVPKMETNLQPLFAPQSLPSSSALDSDYPRVPDISSPHLADPQTHLPILPSIEVSAAPLSSYLIPATPLTPENAQKIQVESLRRILSAEEAMSGKRFASARGMWQTVVARVVGRDPPSEKGDNGEAKVKSDNDVDNSKEIKDEMRSILVEHVCKDWKARNELCLLWLHEEYLSHPPTYFLWLHTVLLRLRTSLDSKDRMFTKFLLEVPELDESSIDVVRKYVEDKDRRGLGIATFRDLVVLRPAVKDDCLQAILEYTVSPDPEVRKPAIITIRRWYPDNSFVSPIAVKFALEQLESIGTLSQTNDSMEVDSGKDDANRETDGLLSSEVNRRVELAFALSSRRQELLRNVFALYSRANPSVQRCLHVAIAPLIRSIGMGSPVLLDLIRSPPEHGEGLVETVVAVLVERGARPSKELVDAIRNGRKEDQLGTTLLIAILPFSSKTEIFTALPKLLNLLDGDASSRETVKGCFVRLVQAANNTASTSQPSALTTPSSSGAEKPPLTATELLVHLHTMDDPANGGVAIKKVVEATQICLDTSDVFTQEVIAVVLQQLVDRPKLPTVFMRTMMQAVTKYKGLVGFSMGILTRLIGKRVWMDKTLWEGFVRCCRITQPYSFPVLLQLPKPQLQDILTRTTDMRAKLLQHVLSLPPQQRNTARIMNVMPLLMEQQGGPAASPSVNGTVTNQGASAGPGGVKVAS
ncbi:hypothetical protein M427DRAFT_155462 [Gonapodya prolifera JEL478]|uniref:Symplekin C-terminal domain-containing protein n=1 Tax=Gonapodya prolifera (strain JEL478) TaxID=1344416 RepID=A0A139AFU1_GONPJ|nr:hypothetical protein M427DRAFT_155462 [Gonapodya prolifera JEL478]|eukprot:KXS15283.1 hypothetical protein M427DRAFT_155462 [Gonapodya prolifera JEL478]